MSFDNMGWGLQMMALGMGIVFSLLALLWALLVVVLHFDREAAPAAAQAAPQDDVGGAGTAADLATATAPAVPSVNGMEADLVAAILITVLTHKNVRRGQAAPAMRSYSPGSLLYASRWLSSGRTRQNQQWQRRGG